MRSSQKSGRGRGKGNRNKGGASHSPNRVYESAGPEGKVRGTPQQIIDKYLALARDTQLSGDRVASENFLQHAEHYARILIAAQEAANERRDAMAQQSGQGDDDGDGEQDGGQRRGGGNGGGHDRDFGGHRGGGGGHDRGFGGQGGDDQPPADGLAAIDAAQDDGPQIVDTPESKAQRPASRGRRPRPRPAETSGGEDKAADAAET